MIGKLFSFFRKSAGAVETVTLGAELDLAMVGISDTGRVRDHNEDAIQWDAARGLALLADGMGGHNAGDVASRLCLEGFMAALDRPPGQPSRALEDAADSPQAQLMATAIAQAHDQVCQAAADNPDYHGMGTTLVALLFSGRRVVVGHVGDSRVYRLRGGQLQQITVDHSLVQELLDRGLMSAEQAQESVYGHVVTRAIGSEQAIEPDIQELEVQAGDIFILCSDGLSDLVSETEMSDTLQAAAGQWSRAVQHLVDLANQHGGTDNISVVLVAVGGPKS